MENIIPVMPVMSQRCAQSSGLASQRHAFGAVGADGFLFHQRAQDAPRRFRWVAPGSLEAGALWSWKKLCLTVQSSRGVVDSPMPAGRLGASAELIKIFV